MAVLSIFSSGSAFAQEIDPSELPSIYDLGYFSDPETARDGIHHFFTEEDTLELIPEANPGLIQFISEETYNIGVEAIYYIPFSFTDRQEDQLLQIVNIFTNVSSLKGIEYYSVSRGRMHEFYYDSYRIKAPGETDPVNDLYFTSMPSHVEFYMFQHDASMGKNEYTVHITQHDKGVNMFIKNLTPMRYRLLPFVTLVKPEGMRSGLSVELVQEGVLFSAVIAADAANFLGLKNLAEDAFYNRLHAMFSWLKDQLTAPES